MRYYILVGTVAAVMAAWSGGWFYKAGQLRDEIQLRASQSSPAREWAYRDMAITGFPFRLQVDLSSPHIALRGQARELLWESDQIKAVGHPWQPHHILFDVTGRHRFKARLSGHWRELTLDSSEAMASLETDAENRPERLSLDVRKILLRYNGAPALQGERLQLHSRSAPDIPDGLDLALSGETLEVAAGALPSDVVDLPRTAKLVDLQARVTGLPKGGLTLGGLPQWRDGGGTLEVKTFHLQWGDMDISATGSLALDAEMRPIGALTARIKGHDELLDIAMANGMMDEDNLATARAVLGLLAAAGGGVLSVPVRLQDGQLFLGPAVVAKLARITDN
ncbi:MAG: DUF2125 domain-containing protein [Alphaproteobacteria bacterium]|nr:DUF2125 domain-containing protein [Alphaproteobacteria bacterium]